MIAGTGRDIDILCTHINDMQPAGDWRSVLSEGRYAEGGVTMQFYIAQCFMASSMHVLQGRFLHCGGHLHHGRARSNGVHFMHGTRQSRTGWAITLVQARPGLCPIQRY